MTTEQEIEQLEKELKEINAQYDALWRQRALKGQRLVELKYGRTTPGGVFAARGIDVANGNGKVKDADVH